MADDRSNPEILPPPKWLIPRPTATQRKWIVAGSASALVGFILWAFNEFTSLRGVFHVLMSRFILAGMWVAGVLLLVLLVSVLQLPYKRTIVLIVSLIWAAGLLGLDWLAPKQQTVTIAQPCSSITVTPNSEIVGRVHLRAKWVGHSSDVFTPLFQDLFHDWVITVTPTGAASHVIISIEDARKPTDDIRVDPPEDAVISEVKPKWFSGFSEPSQVPDSYVRTVSFATLDKPEVITIRKPIKSHFGVNRITSLDLDIDRQIHASADNCPVALTPLSDSISGANPRFYKLTDQLKSLAAQKVSGTGFITRLDPDEPYPPLGVNEREMIQELRCKNSPCKDISVTMAVTPKKVVEVK